MTELNEENFSSTIKENNVVLVDFWAIWCGPCRACLPILESLEKLFPEVKFCKVNVDLNQELSSHYAISSIPAILLFKNGELKDTLIGVHALKTYEEKLKNLI